MLYGACTGSCDLKREDLKKLTITSPLSKTTAEKLPFRIFTLESHRFPQLIRVGGDAFEYLCEDEASDIESSRWYNVQVKDVVEVEELPDVVGVLQRAGKEVLLAGDCFTVGDEDELWFHSLAIYVKTKPAGS